MSHLEPCLSKPRPMSSSLGMSLENRCGWSGGSGDMVASVAVGGDG